MLYLKLSRNQGREWSPVTVSSLAKKIIGVNNIVVENVDLETTAKGEQLVIRARPWKSSQKRCSVCGKECPGFDQGKGLCRWRAPDFAVGSRSSLRPKRREFAARSTALSCNRFLGRGTDPASQGISRILRFGCRSICPEKPARSICG